MMIINPYIFQSIDPNAQAFLTAIGNTNSTIQTAINELVLDLKSYSIYNKFYYIYPYVGGTATSHKFNLINPLDTDAAYRITWNGGLTHDANGVTGNGTNGYGETWLTPSSAMTLNDTHISVYCRTNSQSAVSEMGIQDSLGNRGIFIVTRNTSNVAQYYVNDFTVNNTGNTNSQGFYIATRTSSTAKRLYKNGAVISAPSTASVSLPNVSIPVHGRKNYNGMNGYSAKNLAFISSGQGLNATEAANFYTAVQKFQTTLGRNV